MSAKEDDRKLRFNAGQFEDLLVTLVMGTQFALVAGAIAIVFGFLALTTPLAGLIDIAPIIISMLVVAYALGYLLK